MTYARYLIDTIESPDDEHMVARNMYSSEINIYGKELCVKLVVYKNNTDVHSQPSIRKLSDINIYRCARRNDKIV